MQSRGGIGPYCPKDHTCNVTRSVHSAEWPYCVIEGSVALVAIITISSAM